MPVRRIWLAAVWCNACAIGAAADKRGRIDHKPWPCPDI
jgi:hypothetical protein